VTDGSRPKKETAPGQGQSKARGRAGGKAGGKAAGKAGGRAGSKARGKAPAKQKTGERTQPGTRKTLAPETMFAPTLTEMDLHLYAEGRHPRVQDVLGAHLRTLDGVTGTSFAIWAPAAQRVSVVGDFCDWDGGRHPLRPLGTSGVHEIFVPGVQAGSLYKFEIETLDGRRIVKTDPYGRMMEQPPGHASRVIAPSTHAWGDAEWLSRRRTADPLREPLSVYEVHLGSWARIPDEGNRSLGYREIAPHLARRAKQLGFTHVELMPIMEYPFAGSWGYQVTGYYAPTSRFGTPDDLRFLVDTLHQAGLGVLLDWVPAHFPADDHGLATFDGTPLYEHADPRQGRHPDWDTLIFNYGRHEVANLLLSNALYWLEQFHFDGLRVDAVASMLYLDFSRDDGDWLPNIHGGSENLEAIEFIKQLNVLVHSEAPGCLMIAEESTSYPGVTTSVEHGGLGFDLKWNLGWMHDTLTYFSGDPLFRGHHQQAMTFPVAYEHTEHFLMPLSHDEVVHGKGSLFGKMHGDRWQKLANLRLLLAYQFTRPGKKLLFMGSELASPAEWDHDQSLDWHLEDEPDRQGLIRFFSELHAVYSRHPCLWRGDPEPDNFEWIDCEDREQAVFSYQRRHAGEHLIVVLNMTPVPRPGYRIGAPWAGTYHQLLCSDDTQFGGSGVLDQPNLPTETAACHGHEQSLVLDLPPLAALVLGPEGSQNLT
jgi:1,4-alpha-glucan branching enzyme